MKTSSIIHLNVFKHGLNLSSKGISAGNWLIFVLGTALSCKDLQSGMVLYSSEENRRDKIYFTLSND